MWKLCKASHWINCATFKQLDPEVFTEKHSWAQSLGSVALEGPEYVGTTLTSWQGNFKDTPVLNTMPGRQQPHKGLMHDNWSNSCLLWQETSLWPMSWRDSSWIWAFSQKLLCGGMFCLPVCPEGQKGNSWVYQKRSGQEVARVNLQVSPKQLESIYFSEPGRGRRR